MDPDQIAKAIETLPLREALSYLVARGILDLGGKGYDKLRKIITAKSHKEKFGFVPNKDEANILKTVVKKQYYSEFSSLLPKHKYSDLVRTGYLVSNLNKKGDHKRVEGIRESICDGPNGAYLIKIVNLVTTGAIVPVIDYLSELKKKNYDNEYLEKSFEEMIGNWQKYAYFVQAGFSENEIYEHVKCQISLKRPLIMVFAYGSANLKTKKAVGRIITEGLSENYSYSSKDNKEGDKEAHSSTFQLIEWI